MLSESPFARVPRKGAVKKTAGKAPAKKPKVAAKRVERIVKTRVVFPRAWYEEHKDEIKAPFKLHDMKWNYLGEGKGLYKREKEVHCFAQFDDAGTHYSIWGDDKKACDEILKAWRTLAGEQLYAQFLAAGVEATASEAQEKESEAMRLWKLQEPQPRPGEPDFFLKKRIAEWEARKPQ